MIIGTSLSSLLTDILLKLQEVQFILLFFCMFFSIFLNCVCFLASDTVNMAKCSSTQWTGKQPQTGALLRSVQGVLRIRLTGILLRGVREVHPPVLLFGKSSSGPRLARPQRALAESRSDAQQGHVSATLQRLESWEGTQGTHKIQTMGSSSSLRCHCLMTALLKIPQKCMWLLRPWGEGNRSISFFAKGQTGKDFPLVTMHVRAHKLRAFMVFTFCVACSHRKTLSEILIFIYSHTGVSLYVPDWITLVINKIRLQALMSSSQSVPGLVPPHISAEAFTGLISAQLGLSIAYGGCQHISMGS